ncbi:MAG: LPS export ABC transporter periplasmic protein LptC [Bacteroidota bacterium]|nr:LPS export ABC transporter periplasmic protein LptC [Bacteroidota bacterium]
MKKIIIAVALLFGTFSFVNAQTPTAVTKETKRQKKEKFTQSTTTSNGMKKDGTPDMRLKANKARVQTTTQANVTTQTKPAVNTQPSPTVPTQVTSQKRTRTQVQPQMQPQVQQRNQVSTTTTKTADPVIETDAKGRTIYQGSKGGKYYINKNGHKEYIK